MGRQRHSSRRSSLAKTVDDSSHPGPEDANDAGEASLSNATRLSSDGTVSDRVLGEGAGRDDGGDQTNSCQFGADVDVDASDYGCDTMTLYPGRSCYRTPSTHGTSAYVFHSMSSGPYSDR